MGYLIDGNNVAGAKGMNRQELRGWLLDSLRHARARVLVVFDGPPPAGSPVKEFLGRLEVRYAGQSSADDLLVRLAKRGEIVVTADRELATRVRAAGARVIGPRELRFSRADAKRRGARRASSEPGLGAREIADWEAYFNDSKKGESE